MIIEEIKKANIEAMKSRNANLRSIYSVIMNKYMQSEIESRVSGKPMGDEEVVRIIQKTIKELIEEAENYKKVNNTEQFNKINEQKAVLESYLPKMLSTEEIKVIISKLEDKSVPSVMRYFKNEYGSQADLKLVGEVLRTI